jgi:hypothetical protein
MQGDIVQIALLALFFGQVVGYRGFGVVTVASARS